MLKMVDGKLVPLDAEDEALLAADQAAFAGTLARGAVRAAFEARVAAGLPVAGRSGTVQLDPASRQEIASAVLMAQLGAWPPGGFWRLSDNSNLALTGAQVQTLGKSAAGRYQGLFAARSAMLDAIAGGQTVDPEAGWPATAPFDPAA